MWDRSIQAASEHGRRRWCSSLRDATNTKGGDMTESTERAVLAGGCFWGVQELVRKLPGVISTRVGYTGGDVPNATYRNHGTHAEGIEIIFDPSVTSFRDLLEFFFQIHDPTTQEPTGQRRRSELPVGHLLHIRRAADGRRGDDRRRRRGGPVAWQGRHRGGVGGSVLGGRARAPGLPAAVSERLHMPLRQAGLEAAPTRSRVVALLLASQGSPMAPTRMLFTTRPLAGHFEPLVPLAVEARSAGHSVAFATGEPYTSRARARRVRCVPCWSRRRVQGRVGAAVPRLRSARRRRATPLLPDRDLRQPRARASSRGP